MNTLGPIMSSEGNVHKTRQGITKCSITGKNEVYAASNTTKTKYSIHQLQTDKKDNKV
jgi:hypothetical protein